MSKYSSLVYFTVISFLFLCNNCIISAKELKSNPEDCVIIDSNLSFGSVDNSWIHVSILQKYLRQKKYLKSGPSWYYGALTRNAVKVFQDNNGLIPTWNLDIPTRNKIKALSCYATTSKEKRGIENFMTYSDFDRWFSISYPKYAYMKTKCWVNMKDELVSLGISYFDEIDTFLIWYSKELKNCQLVTHNPNDGIQFGDSGIVFQIIWAESKEEFIREIYGSDCIIDTKKSDSTLRFTQPIQNIKIKKSDSIKKCVENNSCPNEVFTCSDPKMYFYDPVFKKWVAIQYSNADYYIQKYPTYGETMKKWSYDMEIIQSFKFLN